MGNAPSNPTLDACLTSVFANPSAGFATPQTALYANQWVKNYNLDIPVVPIAVTRPSTPQEVSGVVKCAAASNLKVQPRGGGHSYGNFGLGGVDGAVVVDLVNFQQFSMDNNTWHATIGAGTLLGDVTTRLNNAGGRAMAHGTCPEVGIGGHATIGGLGPTSRQWGAALDHVIGVKVVLANGTITQASDTENSDLFWALKGSAAGFGIITEFLVKTEVAPGNIVQYQYNFTPGSHADMAPIFEAWQTLISDPKLSRQFASELVVSQLGLTVSGIFFGTQAEYDATGINKTLPYTSNSSAVVFDNWLGAVAHWAEDVFLQVGSGIAAPFYSKSLAFRNDTLMSSETIKDLFSFFDTADKGTLGWAAIFDLEGGAINDVPSDATAYGHRDALYYVQTYAVGIPSVSNATKTFLTDINNKIQSSMPNAQLGAYAGYVDPELVNPQQQYWGSNLPRLQQLKAKYDPTDIFHNPQSVRPAT